MVSKLWIIIFASGVFSSILGVGLIFWGWYGYQQAQAAYLSCEANRPPIAPYSCHSVLNGDAGPGIIQMIGILLVIVGLATTLLAFPNIKKQGNVKPSLETRVSLIGPN